MNRRTDEAGVRNIQTTKGSYYVTLPIAMVRKLGWRERQKVVVEQAGKKLVIKDWKG